MVNTDAVPTVLKDEHLAPVHLEGLEEIALIEQLVNLTENLERDTQHRIFRYLISRLALSIHRIV